MLENISKAINHGNKKKMIILITGVVVLALVLCVGAVCWNIQHNARVKEARKQCEVQVAQVTKANQSWKKLIKNSLLVSFAKEDSENGKLLSKLMKLRIPETVVCNANSPEALGSQSAQAIAAAQWYSDNAQRIRSITSIMIDKAAGDEASQEAKKKDEEAQKQLQKITAPVIRKAPRINRRPKLNIPNIPPDDVEKAKKKAQEDAAAKKKADEEAKKKKEEEEKKKKEDKEKLKKEILKELEEAAKKKAEEEKKKNQNQQNGGEGNTAPPVTPAPPQGQGGNAGGTGTGSGSGNTAPPTPAPPATVTPAPPTTNNGGNGGGNTPPAPPASGNGANH